MRFLSLLSVALAFVASQAAGQALSFDDARPYGEGFSRVGEAIVCSTLGRPVSKKGDRQAGAVWQLVLRQTAPQEVRFSAEGVADEMDESSKFSLYADVTYADGSHQWGVSKTYDPAVATGWHRREISLRPKLPIASVSFYLFVRGGCGKARFRAPQMETVVPDGRPRLDGVVLTPDAVPRQNGFFLRDFAGGQWVPAASFSPDVVVESGQVRTNGARQVRVSLRFAGKADRCVTLLYVLPLPEGPLAWCASPQRTTPLKSDSAEQAETASAACGGGISIWPFGAVTCADRGVALGIDPFVPCPYRVGASPSLRLLYIAFDVALVAERPVSEFSFVAFPYAAQEGFRGALERYAALYPEAYRVRAPHQGNWMAFHSISNLPHFEDFGFRFKEGESEVAFDDAHGIYSFYYTEPATWWMKLGKPGEGAAKTTRAACAEQARQLAEKGDSAARSWLMSAILDAAGMPYGEIRDMPWCNGIVWALNCTPGQAGEITDFSRKVGEKALVARYGREPAAFPSGLDGEYVDSSNLPVAPSFDFDRRHFAGLRTPIAFTADPPHRPGVYKGMLSVEYVRGVAEAMHARGRLAMANTTPVALSLPAMWLDVMGIETNWKRGGSWDPMPLDDLYYRRAVCLAKPFCFLQNTDFTRFSSDDVERYFARCLAFGMFPSFFSANAATGHYFSQPALYERDRPLFRKYLPLVTALAEAGWRPVNLLVRTDDAAVVCEQFGEDCFTLYNPKPKERTVVLRTDRPERRVTELLTSAETSFAEGRLEVTLPPEGCRVYRTCQRFSDDRNKVPGMPTVSSENAK